MSASTSRAREKAIVINGNDTPNDDLRSEPSGRAMQAYRQTAEHLRDQQYERAKSLDLKLIATFPLNAGLLAVLSASLQASAAWYVWIFTTGAIACFGFYLGYAMSGYRRRDWSSRPDLATLRAVARDYPPEIVDEWIGLELSNSIDWNEDALDEKAVRTWRAFLFTIGVATFVLVAVISTRLS